MCAPVISPTTATASRSPKSRGTSVQRSVRLVVLAAVAIGVFVGAMSCAAGMANGEGHGVHAGVSELRDVQADGGHGRHGPSSTGLDAPAPSTSPERDTGAIAIAQGHPGMACVTSVQLREPDLVVPGDVSTADEWSALPPADCVTELEPPVPRFS